MTDFSFSARPRRPEIIDSMGRKRTLSTGAATFEVFPVFPDAHGECVLFLGLGPQPDMLAGQLPDMLARAGLERAAEPDCYYLEAPGFAAAMGDPAYAESVRSLCWRDIFVEETPEGRIPDPVGACVDFVRARRPLIIRYIQSPRLFPEFWGPVYAALGALTLDLSKHAGASESRAGAGQKCGARPVVLLPGSDSGLMHREVADALEQMGYGVLALPVAPDGNAVESAGSSLTPALIMEQLRGQLRTARPEFMLSVNLRGLDRGGEAFYLLRSLGIPVAVWFVDNPWLILSTLRQPWWKEARLFVTDTSFIEPLKEHGARHVFHLPLAASRFFDCSEGTQGAETQTRSVSLPRATRLLFVGRSSFPEKDRYFAAVPKGGVLVERAAAMAARGSVTDGLPDFNWWVRQSLTGRLWPGNDVRFAGWGAEYANVLLKSRWLTVAAEGMEEPGLAVVGDNGWRDRLPPSVPLLPQVDYYRDLPGLYRTAPFTLNITSLLLPAGLTQRHFDVWTAGGFLLTNRNAGLDIFPPELTGPVALDAGEDIVPRMHTFLADPGRMTALKYEWIKHIKEYHTYKTRLTRLSGLLF